MRMGLASRVQELSQLVRLSIASQRTGAEATLATVATAARRIAESTGVRLEDLKILEIGPGQRLRHLRCFALKNEVVGIDTDVIPQGHLNDYLQMLYSCPPMRSAKTLGRKMLGQDARFATALARGLGVRRFPRLQVLRMSATNMEFPDASFDCVFSCSVFEHIDDPGASLAEVKRVLRPGGVAYISLHLYTSHSGQHDPKIFAQGAPVAPLWPHLRPEYEDTVHPSACLNRLRLREWRELFKRIMPGTQFVHERQDHEMGDGLQQLRAAGSLAQFSDEELMTVNLVAIWKKPAAS
jgi:SAM-dependent methyltransferase